MILGFLYDSVKLQYLVGFSVIKPSLASQLAEPRTKHSVLVSL